MKFHIEKALLETIINKLGKTLDVNTSLIPILNSVKVSANEDAIQFAASNGDDAVIINEGLNDKDDTSLIIEKAGEVCLPKEAFKVFKKLKKGLVTFEVNAEETQVKITQKRTVLDFGAFNGKGYPNLQPTSSPIGLFLMPVKTLSTIVDKAVHSVADNSDSRPILQAINFNLQADSNNELAFTAYTTDSRRLSRVQSVKALNNELPITTFNLKGTTLKDICSKTFEKHTGEHLYIQAFGNAVLFLIGDFQNGNRGNYTTVILRQLQGDFPDVTRLIPQIPADGVFATFDKDDLYSSLDLIKMMDGNRDTIMNLQNDLATFKSKLEAGSTSKGKQELIITTPVDRELEIGYNTKNLMDALRSIDTDEVEFQLIAPLRPFLIVPIVDKNELAELEHLELMLPVRYL